MLIMWRVVRDGTMFQPQLIIDGIVIRFRSELTYRIARHQGKYYKSTTLSAF